MVQHDKEGSPTLTRQKQLQHGKVGILATLKKRLQLGMESEPLLATLKMASM